MGRYGSIVDRLPGRSRFTTGYRLRGRELALLRAVGAKPRQIRWLLLGEAVLVALAAGLVGVAP